MSTVVLVSCSAGKESKPMLAEKLYNSDLFKKQLEYAKKLASPNNIYIISAKYHLVPLNKTIAPYNLTLKDYNGFSFKQATLDDYKIWVEDLFSKERLND